MHIRHAFTNALLCSLLFAANADAGEQRFYRYTNLEGHVVIDDRVPSAYVGQGYEVINGKGVVLETVARRLTEEDREAQAALEREQQARQQAQERDKQLLLRYSSIEDIEAAKQRSLGELKIRLGILKSNRSGLAGKMEQLQAQAADLERQGRPVGEAQLAVMDDLRDELLQTEQSIAAREAEMQAVAADFDQDIERFGDLLELVEWRRQRERGASH
jgi:chromosome segregation ATPase